jgi:hypothetical protein
VFYLFRKQGKINVAVTDTAAKNKLLQKLHHTEKYELSLFV